MLIASPDVHDRIIALLDGARARYHALDHAPEGRPTIVSRIRGNPLKRTAKATVLALRHDNGSRSFVLAVVPGDRRIDLHAVAGRLGGSSARRADAQSAIVLTACTKGALPPFSFDPRLRLLVDSRLVAEPEIVFHCGRLDRSLFLATEDYVRLTQPMIADIST